MTRDCGVAWERVGEKGGGALYICPVSIATVGLGLEFLTTMF